jgi:hypothetical protein
LRDFTEMTLPPELLQMTSIRAVSANSESSGAVLEL